ncbi:MAG: hypothetical protein IJC66_11765 [Kiritimatiellae bacterium]|nr:hypothetical protein [Kiritimatiellia bacterium]
MVEMTPVAAEGELAWSTFHQPSEFQIVNAGGYRGYKVRADPVGSSWLDV